MKSQAFDAHKSAVRSQWKNIKADMQDDKLDNQAEYDQTDIADAWDVTMIQEHQTWENQ